MKYPVSWDLKTDSNSLSLMQARGNDLVKAMQTVGDNRRQGNQSTAVKRGLQQSRDMFARDMLAAKMRVDQYHQSEKNIIDGMDLLKNVKAMLTQSGGLQSKIRESTQLWSSMNDTGRELQNQDLKNILQIRENIGVIFDMCTQLRHNGSSVFGKTNNFQQTMEGQRSSALGNSESGLQGVMYQGTGRGAVIDFTNFYNSLRQNLIYIRENIKVYKQKATISQRFQNCEGIVSSMIRYANKQQQMFEQVNSGVRFQRKKEEEKMNSLVNQRQNDLTKEAIIGILDGAQNGVALGGTADQGTGRI